jgi:hypothetical protein
MLTSGTIIGIVVLCIAALLALIGIALIISAIFGSSWDSEERGIWGGILVGGATILAIFPIVGFSVVGWNSDYMAYHTVSGKVDQVASRQIADGKGMSQRYVFTIAGQPYGVDDTRAALVKPGDAVTLNCTREFVWGSTNNGYACNWG